MTADVATKTGVANAALVKLGHPANVADVDTDTGKAASAIRHHWPIVRDVLLKKTDWNFATAIVRPSADTATLPGRLTKIFALPNDVIAIRHVEGLADDEWERRAPVIADPAGVLREVDALVTNADAPVIVYTRRVSRPKIWSPDFTAAFIEKLAEAIAPTVARNRIVEADRARAGDRQAMDAARNDAQEGPARRVPTDTTWIRARMRGR